MPRAPALFAGFRETLWLSADGEIEAVSPEEARARLARYTADALARAARL